MTEVATPNKPTPPCQNYASALYMSQADVEAAGITADWDRLVRASHNPQALFHSSAWWRHIWATDAARPPGVFTIRDSQGGLTGVVPFCIREVSLDFGIKRRLLARTRLRAVELLGGEPLLPSEPAPYDSLFGALDETYSYCDCMSMEMLPTNGYCRHYVNESPFIRERYMAYVPDGPCLSHYIELPSSFEGYLAKFPSKTGREVRRQLRRLSEHGGGELVLRRFETREDVQDFLIAAEEVVRHAWQFRSVSDVIRNNAYWRTKLGNLADEGLLRSYVLQSGGRPCAVELGYQFQDTFYDVQKYYDRDFAALAPGTALLYQFLQDLFMHRPPKRLTFGFGDSDFKRKFGNASSLDASVLLLRKSLRNRLRRVSHATFRSAIRRLKSRLRA